MSAIDAIPQIVWAATPDGVCDDFNKRWYELSGGDDVERVLHPDDVPRRREAWEKSLRSGEPFEIECRFFDRHRAEYRWYLERALPARDDGGNIVRWYGTATDIHVAKEAQTHASSFLADASALLTSTLDPETVLKRLAELAVPRLADWCAIDVAQENAPRRRLIITHPDPEKAAMVRAADREYRLPRDLDPVEKVIASGKPLLVESITRAELDALARDEHHLQIIRSLDARSWVIVPIVAGGRRYGAITLVNSESGRRFGAPEMALIEDVAARAGVAVYNAQLYVEAQAANRAKDDFLATLSHELRTPMTAILGWSRLLEIGDLEPDVRAEAIDSIRKSARAQAGLIDDLLDVSRISLGKLQLNIESVDVDEIVMNAVETIRPAAKAKGLAVDVAVDPVHSRVAGDAARLQQVIWNLVNNAVKFTPAGGRIDVTVWRGDDGVRVRVSDSGEGLAPEFVPFVFDRFTQADSTTTRRHGGLGLGLAIVKQITQLHGGTVKAESDGLGRGATFTVTLPYAAARALEEKERPRGSVSHLDDVDVLVVDDDPQSRRYVAAALQHAGARVRLAASAGEALGAIRDAVPHVLLTDIAMPERDGFSLVDDVRNVLRISVERMPAVAMSAYGKREERGRVLAAGFQHYFMKPIDPGDLTRVVAVLANRTAT